MRLSVIFGTRGNASSLPHLQRIFHALEQQTFQDFQTLVVVDRHFENEEEFKRFTDTLFPSPTNSFHIHSLLDKKNSAPKIRFFTNLNSNFLPSQNNASYVRNFGIRQANTELIQLFDDDNDFNATYLETAVNHYDHIKHPEIVICPTLQYRATPRIQNQGFSHFRYRQGRPIINHIPPIKKDSPIQMFSGNGLLGSRQLFQTFPYDENIARIAEDLDFTLTLHEHGAKLFAFQDLTVHHYERDKTKLEQARIGSAAQAHQKARNRFLFIHKHGTKRNKLQFLFIGLPGCILRLSAKALLHGGKQRLSIIRGLLSGVKTGLIYLTKQ